MRILQKVQFDPDCGNWCCKTRHPCGVQCDRDVQLPRLSRLCPCYVLFFLMLLPATVDLFLYFWLLFTCFFIYNGMWLFFFQCRQTHLVVIFTPCLACGVGVYHLIELQVRTIILPFSRPVNTHPHLVFNSSLWPS